MGSWIKHGHARNGGTREYQSWIGMIKRCTKPYAVGYVNYGGRGISVCERWMKFDNFLSDMGIRPIGMTLERKDNEKGYSPDNCKWATNSEQQRNRRPFRNHKTKGYTFVPKLGKFCACIYVGEWVDGKLKIKRKHLGSFDTAEEAHAVHLSARELYPPSPRSSPR